MAEWIKCRHCRKIIGYMRESGKETNGIKEWDVTYSHASVKIIHPYPNKKIKVKDRFCDYCGKSVT